jgi:hypothetical protein
MSLRKSPVLTPALLAANRQNSKRSTGPRTARGKAWSRLNRMRHGARSPEYIQFFKALFDAPDGRMTAHAQTLLASMPVVHPVYWELADLMLQVEIEAWEECRRKRAAAGRA